MVSSGEGVSGEIPSSKLQQKQNSNTGFHESVSTKEGSPLSLLPEKELGKLHTVSKKEISGNVRQIPCTETLASPSSQEGSAFPLMPEKVTNNLQLRQSSDSGIHVSKSNQEGSSLSMIPDKELDNFQQTQSPDTAIRESQSNLVGSTVSIIPEVVSDILQQRQDLDTGVPESRSDQEKFTLSIRPEKVLDKLPLRRNPDIGVHALQSDQEGKTPSTIPDKATEDGYNWRKYGQKHVRGNEFIRSYYKCTFPNCPVKKQVERSHDGHITDINYLWKHEHPKPQHSLHVSSSLVLPIEARRPDEPSLIISEVGSSDVHGETSHHIESTETSQLFTVSASGDVVEGRVSQSNKIIEEFDSGDLDSKRQKRDISSVDDRVIKTDGKRRLVVQTMSEVDIVSDGYRWRKYGQKFVKGNLNPRSYYRCSSAGCPVKKHVERAARDPKVVITTYGGQHDHDMPPSRTVAHNTSGGNTSTTSMNGEPRSEPAKEAVGLELVVHAGAN